MTLLDDRLAELERRIKLLEEDSGIVPDSIAYHGQAVDVNGQVSSSGVTLDAVPVGFQADPTNMVRWVRPSDGFPFASVQTYQDQDTLEASSEGQVVATIYDGGGSVLSQLAVTASSIGVFAGGYGATILDANDQSDFVRAPFGETALDVGSTVIAFTASDTSAPAEVTHRLGRSPVAVVAMGYTGFDIPRLEFINATAADFQIVGRLPAAATLNITVTWIAVG